MSMSRIKVPNKSFSHELNNVFILFKVVVVVQTNILSKPYANIIMLYIISFNLLVKYKESISTIVFSFLILVIISCSSYWTSMYFFNYLLFTPLLSISRYVSWNFIIITTFQTSLVLLDNMLSINYLYNFSINNHIC